MRTLRGAAAALLLAALSLAYVPPVAAQPPQTVTPQGILTLDAARSLKTLCGSLLPDGSLAPCHNALDTTGARIDPATKQLQQQLISIMGTPLQANGHVNIDSSALPVGAASDVSVLAVKAAIQATRTGDHVAVDAAPLPPGASTEATLLLIKGLLAAPALPNGAAADATLQAIKTALGQPYQQGGALPLPAGASTEATLAAIKALLTSPTLPSGAAADATLQQVKAAIQAVRTGDHVTVDAAPLPAGAATAAAQAAGNASLISILSGLPAQGLVVSGDQAYALGTFQPLSLTPTGRLKVGLSSASNINPAAPAATTTSADLTGCVYRAVAATSLDTYTGAVSCDLDGNVRVSLASSGAPAAAAPAKAVQVGGTDGTNLRVFRTRTDGTVIVAGLQEGFTLASGNTASAAQTVYGGDYTFSQVCSGYGSVVLRQRGPDGLTMLPLATYTAADGNGGGHGVTIAGNAVVDVVLTGTSACNATLTRIP